MLFNKTKMFFLVIIIISTLVVMSSSNWLGMWMGLEFNLMAFIPFISKEKSMNSSQAMMIYFLTQSISSILLLFSILMNILFFTNNLFITEIMKMLIMSSIFIKLGAAPFHFWLPEMMANLKWKENFMLMTWQKIAPLMILSNLNPNSKLLYISAALSAMVGAIGGLNQTSLRKILAFSSINHLGWMMAFMSMSIFWYKYLLIYSIIILMACTFFNMKNMLFINQINSVSFSIMEKLIYVMIMFSLGGLPPFIGFLPKWMVIQNMISTNLYFIMLIMMLFSLITLFYYLRMVSSLILSYSTMNKWMEFNMLSKKFLFLSIFINISLPIFSVFSFF